MLKRHSTQASLCRHRDWVALDSTEAAVEPETRVRLSLQNRLSVLAEAIPADAPPSRDQHNLQQKYVTRQGVAVEQPAIPRPRRLQRGALTGERVRV